MSPLRVRHESLADDALVIVRGGLLDRDELIADAERAQKLAQESNSALETYQKQVKMLEERNVATIAKQTAL